MLNNSPKNEPSVLTDGERESQQGEKQLNAAAAVHTAQIFNDKMLSS